MSKLTLRLRSPGQKMGSSCGSVLVFTFCQVRHWSTKCYFCQELVLGLNSVIAQILHFESLSFTLKAARCSSCPRPDWKMLDNMCAQPPTLQARTRRVLFSVFMVSRHMVTHLHILVTYTDDQILKHCVSKMKKKMFTANQLWLRRVREWIISCLSEIMPFLYVQTISPAQPEAPSKCWVRLSDPTSRLHSHTEMWSPRYAWAWGHMVQERAAAICRQRTEDGSSSAGDCWSSGQKNMILYRV